MAKILVVDDERAITDFVLDALSEEGYSVAACHDGASALVQIQAERYSLVLLDIGLPVMTGDVVLRELRAAGQTALPVVVTTASTNAEQYLAIGATDILKKPFTLDRLLTMVATHVAPEESAVNAPVSHAAPPVALAGKAA